MVGISAGRGRSLAYRTSNPVTVRPISIRWISDVPSKIVKILAVGAVSAGERPSRGRGISTDSACPVRDECRFPSGPRLVSSALRISVTVATRSSGKNRRRRCWTSLASNGSSWRASMIAACCFSPAPGGRRAGSRAGPLSRAAQGAADRSISFTSASATGTTYLPIAWRRCGLVSTRAAPATTMPPMTHGEMPVLRPRNATSSAPPRNGSVARLPVIRWPMTPSTRSTPNWAASPCRRGEAGLAQVLVLREHDAGRDGFARRRPRPSASWMYSGLVVREPGILAVLFDARDTLTACLPGPGSPPVDRSGRFGHHKLR
jgi:hypothetical protein